MSRRAFVVAGIVECLQADHGRWELIDSHGAGTVVCPFTTVCVCCACVCLCLCVCVCVRNM